MARQRISQRDTQIVEGSQPCTYCKRTKPLDQFGMARCKGRKERTRAWCKGCMRITERMRHETPERQAWLKAYLARPDVRQRRRESDRRYQAKPVHAAQAAARKLKYARSPRGKLMQCRSRALRRLATASEAAESARLKAVIRDCERQLERIGV